MHFDTKLDHEIIILMSLECHGISNPWQLNYLFKSLFRLTTTTKNTQSPHHCPCVRGIHWCLMDSPHKGTVMQENFHVTIQMSWNYHGAYQKKRYSLYSTSHCNITEPESHWASKCNPIASYFMLCINNLYLPPFSWIQRNAGDKLCGCHGNRKLCCCQSPETCNTPALKKKHWKKFPSTWHKILVQL